MLVPPPCLSSRARHRRVGTDGRQAFPGPGRVAAPPLRQANELSWRVYVPYLAVSFANVVRKAVYGCHPGRGEPARKCWATATSTSLAGNLNPDSGRARGRFGRARAKLERGNQDLPTRVGVYACLHPVCIAKSALEFVHGGLMLCSKLRLNLLKSTFRYSSETSLDASFLLDFDSYDTRLCGLNNTISMRGQSTAECAPKLNGRKRAGSS